MPGKALRSLQWHHLGFDRLWQASKGRGVRVAVLDSGISCSPALPGTRVELRHANGAQGQAPTADSHGTSCASLIASERLGAEGVAPRAELLSIQVGIGQGAVTAGNVARGLRVALDQRCDVISCSFVLPELGAHADALSELVREAQMSGVPVLAASGNDPNVGTEFPEAVPTAIVVAAHDRQRQPMRVRANGWTDLFALGDEVTVVDNLGLPRTWLGQSSGATALVSGVMAVALASVPKAKRVKAGLALDGLAKRTAATLPGHTPTSPRFRIDPAKLIFALHLL